MADTPTEQEAKGIVEQASGRVKKAAGELMDDPKLKREGALEDIKGAAKREVADVRRKFNDQDVD
jgi:uncharacterized protein YjbJ (UPF0337 family)